MLILCFIQFYCTKCWPLIRIKYMFIMCLLILIEIMVTADVLLNSDWEKVLFMIRAIPEVSITCSCFWFIITFVYNPWNVCLFYTVVDAPKGLTWRSNRKIFRLWGFCEVKLWCLQVDRIANTPSTGISCSINLYLPFNLFQRNALRFWPISSNHPSKYVNPSMRKNTFDLIG